MKLSAQAHWEHIARFVRERRTGLQWAAAALMTLMIVWVGGFKGPVKDYHFCESDGERFFFLIVLAGMYGAVMAWFVARKRLDWPHFWYVAAMVLAALFIRAELFNQISGDYRDFLGRWTEAFREHGFRGVTMPIGDYNLPYRYLLAGIAAVPLPDIYLIKLVSVAFDFGLALMVMATVDRFLNPRFGMLALAVMLFIPTGWINSAYWAQCDSIYAFFIVACLYAMLADRPVLSVALLTVAFSFKLQTIFFFPMVLFALLHRKYKLRHAWVFPAVYLLIIIPALLAGGSLWDSLTIYAHQVGEYKERYTLNAPNLYQFAPGSVLYYRPEWPTVLKFLPNIDGNLLSDPTYDRFAVDRINTALVPYAGALVVSLIFYLFKRRKYLTLEQVWRVSLAFVLVMPMVLPRMHDRYFYLAEVFSVLYALRWPKRWFVPVLVVAASFASYMPFLTAEQPLDLRIAALMMAAATGTVLRDLFRTLRAARAADLEAGPEPETYAV